MIRQRCEIFSRVVGYIRPLRQWNNGKREEFKDRESFKWRKELKEKGNSFEGATNPLK